MKEREREKGGGIRKVRFWPDSFCTVKGSEREEQSRGVLFCVTASSALLAALAVSALMC